MFSTQMVYLGLEQIKEVSFLKTSEPICDYYTTGGAEVYSVTNTLPSFLML